MTAYKFLDKSARAFRQSLSLPYRYRRLWRPRVLIPERCARLGARRPGKPVGAIHTQRSQTKSLAHPAPTGGHLGVQCDQIP